MTQIIKAKDNAVQGGFKIALNMPVGDTAQPLPQSVSHTSEPHAAIVQATDQFAVIEVTCTCGNKVSIKCEF